MQSKLTLCLAALLTVVGANAEVTLPSIFGDNMVLQQQTSVNIWGTASPRSRVTITPSWAGGRVSVLSDSAGRWSAQLATPQAGGPYELEISDGKPLRLRNVLLGEVWYCSGQSNMEMPVRGFTNQPVAGSIETILEARPSTPIRMCTVERACSNLPAADCKVQWQENIPAVVSQTSAAAYFFADYLHKVLGVPVGIVVSSWGGSCVEAWLDRTTLSSFEGIDLAHLDVADANYKSPHTTPAVLYNAMVAPLKSFTVRGMLWYQGESNRHNAGQYGSLMTAYASMMRRVFGLQNLPFYYVQIAPYNYETPEGTSAALVREAQLRNLKEIPHSGMVVTTDIGDKDCIHPAPKKEVGRRLAYLALAKTYRLGPIDPDTPVFRSMEVSGSKAVLHFDCSQMGIGPRGTDLKGFEIAGADRTFYAADAKITMGAPGRVEVSSDKVSQPVAVRYQFHNYAEGNLTNAYGLPASPFRTDDWQ